MTTATSRRHFIAATALGGLGALAVGSAAAANRHSTRNQRPFGIALVGYGGYARLAGERLMTARTAKPAAIVTGSPDKARAAAASLGIPDDAIYGYDDYARIANDDRIDAVHICLPVGLHAEHALKAFAAGKHVLCEKPLANTSAQARQMIDAATQAGRVLMPAYRAWFSGPLQDALRRVSSGEHGALVAIDAHKGFAIPQTQDNWRFDPDLAGAGCLYDIGTYSVQLQRWFGGGLPTRVSAQRRHHDDPRFAKVESDIAWWAEFNGGVLATGSASWRYRLQNRLRIGTEQAWIDLDPATPAIGERLRIGIDQPSRIEEIALPMRDQLPAMYDAFAACCLGETAVPITAEDGLADLIMMEALLRSAANGRPETLNADT